MFAPTYFAPTYFSPTYFPNGGAAASSAVPPNPIALFALGRTNFGFYVRSSPATLPDDLLAAIIAWFRASSIASQFPGGIRLEEFPDSPTFPIVLVSQINEQEPGDCIEQHSTYIIVDIFASTARTARTLGRVWHAAFLPNPDRQMFTFSDGTESTTYFESTSTERRRIGPAGTQLWQHSRMYRVFVESTTYVEN